MSALETDRVCECGREFRDARNKCSACHITDRVCECGREFRGTGSKCHMCLSTDRVCECGREFRGHMKKCGPCRVVARTCVGCQRAFRGMGRKCTGCQVSDRVCECGREFRGYKARCWPCQKRAMGPERYSNKVRSINNARRARKRSAEVAGPVSAESYRAILESGPCVYCDALAEHVDHVRPLSRGGDEHESNLVPACAQCNLSKNARLLTEWHHVDRVAHAVDVSLIVAAEWVRLVEGDAGADPGDDGAELLTLV